MFAIFASAFLLAACGGGGGTDGAGSGSPSTAGYALSGQFQKGPFAIGSQVSANVLDGALNPTGTVYNVQTTDDLGHFSVPTGVNGNLVELVGDGFYMDELTGQLSPSRIQLRAVVDLSVSPVVTVNILTSLQGLRLKRLIAQGSSYSAAYSQSRNEVLAAFGVDPTKINSLTTFFSMQITGGTDADSVLLAISAILSKMATNAAATNATSQPAELSNYVNTIASQIAYDGVITFASYKAAIGLAATEVDLTAVRSHIETYYANRGITVVAPKFEEWIDKDASGILPRRLVPATGLSFSNATGVEPGQLITSNIISVNGVGAGVVAPLTVSAGTTVIKNGAAVTGNVSTVADGDTIALRVTSLGYGLTTDLSTITVGTSSATWSVATKPLGGSIAGLTGTGLVLQNNAGDNITISAGSAGFGFPTGVAIGRGYSITVLTQPSSPAQACSVGNGLGNVIASVATDITVTCVTVTTSPTGSLNTVRQGHSATLLGNGKVLVVGGSSLNGFTASAELYDPATGNWTATGYLNVARGYHTATLLPNGKVLVTGGKTIVAGNIGISLASSELYDPTMGTWTPTGNLNVARSVHTATLLPNGLVLVVGGLGSGSNNSQIQRMSSAELFDPSTGNWTPAGSLHIGRQYHASALLSSGKVLVVGGGPTPSAELYDPASDSWTVTGSPGLNDDSLIQTVQLSNGKVLASFGSSTAVQLYDPNTGTWAMTGSLNTLKNGQFSLLANGKVLALGFSASGTELYDPTSGTWTRDGSIATLRNGLTATRLATGKVLVAGGSGMTGEYLLGCELY